MSFWSSKRVLVTGGAGFLGSFVVEKLQERGAIEIFVPRSKVYDLVQMEAVQWLYKDAQPDIVIHLAARVGVHRGQTGQPGQVLLRQPHDGRAAHGSRPSGRDREIRRGRDHLLVPQVHPGAVQGRRPLERLPGRVVMAEPRARGSAPPGAPARRVPAPPAVARGKPSGIPVARVGRANPGAVVSSSFPPQQPLGGCPTPPGRSRGALASATRAS